MSVEAREHIVLPSSLPPRRRVYCKIAASIPTASRSMSRSFMKRLAAFTLLLLLGASWSVPAFSLPNRTVRKEPAASRKAEKKQRKAIKKYQKAQRKAQQKMVKTDQKNNKRLNRH
jgi:hypothetical protein